MGTFAQFHLWTWSLPSLPWRFTGFMKAQHHQKSDLGLHVREFIKSLTSSSLSMCMFVLSHAHMIWCTHTYHQRSMSVCSADMISVHVCMYTYIAPGQQKSYGDISKKDSGSDHGVSVQRLESTYILGTPHCAMFSHTYARSMSISKTNNSNAGIAISKTDINQHHRKRGYTNSQRSNGSSIWNRKSRSKRRPNEWTCSISTSKRQTKWKKGDWTRKRVTVGNTESGAAMRVWSVLHNVTVSKCVRSDAVPVNRRKRRSKRRKES